MMGTLILTFVVIAVFIALYVMITIGENRQ